MDVKDIIKKYGGGTETMEVVADVMSEYVPKDVMHKLSKMVYENTQGKHFNEEFAKEQISKMSYEDGRNKFYGPFYDDVSAYYQQNKRKLIFPYNKWDFEVAMNLMKSDMYPLLKEWFPNLSKEDLDEKVIELTVNFLNDEDYGDSKIWCYFK